MFRAFLSLDISTEIIRNIYLCNYLDYDIFRKYNKDFIKTLNFFKIVLFRKATLKKLQHFQTFMINSSNFKYLENA
jgi:hypothetical protein